MLKKKCNIPLQPLPLLSLPERPTKQFEVPDSDTQVSPTDGGHKDTHVSFTDTSHGGHRDTHVSLRQGLLCISLTDAFHLCNCIQVSCKRIERSSPISSPMKLTR